MVIIFWGAFEQAGGLMNLYTDAKTDRMLGWQVPTVMFQSLNAGFIILFATGVAGFGQNVRKGKRGFVDFKMAIGIIIMVSDFIYGFAAMEFEKSGSSSDMVGFSLFISYHWRALSFACSIIIYYKLFQ
jgi:POT family proton-dependent oligopeptide transporter